MSSLKFFSLIIGYFLQFFVAIYYWRCSFLTFLTFKSYLLVKSHKINSSLEIDERGRTSTIAIILIKGSWMVVLITIPKVAIYCKYLNPFSTIQNCKPFLIKTFRHIVFNEDTKYNWQNHLLEKTYFDVFISPTFCELINVGTKNNNLLI